MKKLYFFLLLLLALAFTLNLFVGSVHIPIGEIISILTGEYDEGIFKNIILNYRLPRAVTAVFAGIGLSISGLLMQTFFRNPLAGPYVLGISSGASLGVALVVLGGVGLNAYLSFSEPGQWMTILGAICGALLVFVVILIFSRFVSDVTSLLIIGLMFSSATAALVSVLQYFSQPESVKAFLIWTFGDLASVTRQEMYIMLPILMLALIGSVFLIKPLNILQLGETYARNAGLAIKRTRYMIIGVTAVLAGTITAFCGPIAFIGLAVPHIARMVLDQMDHRRIMPVAAIIGAIVLLVCDVLSRAPGFTQTLPLNAITSLFGGPLVIWLIVRKKNLQSQF